MAESVAAAPVLLGLTIACRCGIRLAPVALVAHQDRSCRERPRFCEACRAFVDAAAYADHREACPVPCLLCDRHLHPIGEAQSHYRDVHNECFTSEEPVSRRALAYTTNDIVGSQALFLRFVQQQIGRKSSSADLSSLMAAWPDPVHDTTWLIVSAQLVEDRVALALLTEARRQPGAPDYEALTMGLMSAGILRRLGRHADAEAVLVNTRSLVHLKCDIERVDDELCDSTPASDLPFLPSVLMLCHMGASPAERRRLAMTTPGDPGDDEVGFRRDPLDGVDIGNEVQWDTLLALHSLRLGSHAIFHVDGPYLHAVVPDFSDFGFAFEYVGGKRFFMHANLYPNIVAHPAFQGDVERPMDPLPDGTRVRVAVDGRQMKMIGDAFPWAKSIWCTATEMWLGVPHGTFVHPWQHPATIGGLTVRLRRVMPLTQGGDVLNFSPAFIAQHNLWPNLRPGSIVRHSRRCPITSAGVLCTWQGQTVLTYSTHGFFPHTPAVEPVKSARDLVQYWLMFRKQRRRRLHGKVVYHCGTTSQPVGVFHHTFDRIEPVINDADCRDNTTGLSLLSVDLGNVQFKNMVGGIRLLRFAPINLTLKQTTCYLDFHLAPARPLSLTYVGVVSAFGNADGTYHTCLHVFQITTMLPNAIDMSGICGCPIYDGDGNVYGFARFIDNKLKSVSCTPTPGALELVPGSDGDPPSAPSPGPPPAPDQPRCSVQ
ncbi:C2H2-type domain-containing protein [Plasmodiophora brassicae]